MKTDTKCKCGRVSIGFISDVAICKQCFKRLYERYGDKYALRSDLVTIDSGRRQMRRECHELIDFTDGSVYFTREKNAVKGRGCIKYSNYKKMIASGELHETSDGLVISADAVRDQNGAIIHVDNVKKFTFTCATCKKSFVARDPYSTGSAYICSGCLMKSGAEKCASCGRPVTNATLRDKLIAIGIETRVSGFCEKCITVSLPFIYHSNIKLDGIGRTAGIEIECEPTVQSQIDLALWGDMQHMVTGITDGSLRGKFPCEFVSPILHESNYELWLEELGKRLVAGVYVRCGLHVHIGTTNEAGERYSWFEMNNLMRYLKRYEGFFFSVVSPSRMIPDVVNGNNAGLPVTLPDIPKFASRKDLLDWCYGPERVRRDVGKHIRDTKRCNDRNVHYNGKLNRYQWANFHGHWFKGAIEIRIHQGTANVEKMRNWMEFWFNIVPHAAKDESAWRHPMKVLPKHLELYYTERIKRFKKLAAFRPQRLDQ